MMNSTTLYLVKGSAGRALNRRTFLLGGGALLWRRQSPFSVAVRLEAQPGVAGREIVSFGLPLPPGLLDDPDAIQVLNEDGRDVEVSVVPLETWRLGGREGSLRSVLIQAALDFEHEETRRLSVRLQVSSGKRISPLAPPADSIPRIWALLPPEWLCASEVAGPQVSASQSGNLADYDRLAERNFPGSLAFLDSPVYHHWLFDRTTCYYKLYIRTGELRYLEAAHRAASFVREHTRMDGPDAGCFTPKGPDVKYVYPRAMHLHYLLTGDERAHAAGEAMARFCLERWEPGYRPERYRPVSADVDPEAGREFWSPRHEAYGFLGVLHGWELTGREEYWRKSLAYADALYRHQTRPPDARPADGSFRQDWALYDPSESRLPGATSAWMSAILLDALFSYWRLSSDPRVPEMVVRFCDFLDRRGLVPDGSRAYYVIDCFGSEAAPEAPGPQDQGMERHNTEIAASFAMGIFFSRDREERQRFRGRFDRLFSGAARLDLNRPPRCFNWALQSSSQLVYFLKNAAALLLTLAFAHALPACSAERGAERAPTIETPAAEIEEYRILLRALGGGEDNERTRQQATARELLADRDLPAVLPELLRDDTAEQKRQLAKALGRTEDIRVVPFLIDLFPDDEIGLWVQSALAALGEPAAGELWAEIPVPPEAAAFPETGALPTTVARWCQGAFHQMGPRAVPFLVGKFRSGDSGDRRKALGILAWMHSSTFDLTDWREEVRADLHRALDAPDAATRLGALRVLAEIDEARAVESYGRRLQGDPDRHVALVAEGLVRDGGGRPPCLEEAARIRDLLGRGEIEPAKELMGEVIGVQKGFCDRDLAAALIPVLREEQRGAREAAIEGLGYTVSLSARRALGEAFRIEPDPELRVKILGAGVADPAATVLPLLDNRTPDEEALMIEMLGRERVREAVPALVRRLQHDTLALPAATALGAIGEPAALPSLLEAFEQTHEANLQRRGVLLGSIEKCGGLQAVPHLGRVLLGRDPGLRPLAASGLARIVSPFGRLERVRALVRPITVEALQSADANVRDAIVEVIEAIGGSERLGALVKADPDLGVRTKAREALSSMCEPEAARVLTAWLSERDRRLQIDALTALSHHRRCEWDDAFTAVLWSEAGPPLLALLRGSDEELAADAGSALAWIHLPAGLDAIIEEFERRPALRLRLAYSLYNYGQAAEKAVPTLMKARPDAPPDLARAIDQILRGVEKR